MTKDVLLSISGLHLDMSGLQYKEIENAPIEIITPASYYFKNGKHFVIYDEVTEGVAGTTKNKIKITGEHLIEMAKSGVSNVNISFEKGKKDVTYYSTPLGQLLLGVHTRDMQVDVAEENINVKMSYLLEMNQIPFADCEVKMNIKAKNAKDFDIREEMQF